MWGRSRVRRSAVGVDDGPDLVADEGREALLRRVARLTCRGGESADGVNGSELRVAFPVGLLKPLEVVVSRSWIAVK